MSGGSPEPDDLFGASLTLTSSDRREAGNLPRRSRASPGGAFLRHLSLWLRRAVAIVAVTIGLPVVILIGAALISREQGNELIRLETRTREGPLTGKSIVTDSLSALVGRLPPSTSASRDAYRIAIEPADESRSYALAVWRDSSSSTAANAALLIVENRRVLGRYAFLVPLDVFKAFAARLDALLEHHGGDRGSMCIDGTPVGFERRRGDLLFSGNGNCRAPYRRVRALALALARLYGPKAQLPRAAHWHRLEDSHSGATAEYVGSHVARSVSVMGAFTSLQPAWQGPLEPMPGRPGKDQPTAASEPRAEPARRRRAPVG